MGRTVNPTGSTELYAQTSPDPVIYRDRDASDDDFGRFKELAGKLVKVPKDELDKRRKAAS